MLAPLAPRADVFRGPLGTMNETSACNINVWLKSQIRVQLLRCIKEDLRCLLDLPLWKSSTRAPWLEDHASTWKRSWPRTPSASPICSEFCCTATVSTQCNMSEPSNHGTTPQSVYTHQSLCLCLLLSSFTYSLVCSYRFTSKLLYSPRLVTLCFQRLNIFSNHDSLDTDALSWCATLFCWRFWWEIVPPMLGFNLLSHIGTSVSHMFTAPIHHVNRCM